ncbi:MAG: CAP domain-containing protein [Pirellulales bacterium]
MFGSILALGAGLALSFAPPQNDQAPAQPLDLHPVEARVIERTNSQRIRHGLRPLRVDRRLVGSARRHAAWMTNSRSMTHTSDSVAENIAMGQNSSAEVINAWMNSSGHRANILNPGYTRIGVAAYVTPGGTIYWCQQFLR